MATNLENSEMWQLAVKIADQVREAVKTVPRDEQYSIATTAVGTAVTATSDIAYAVGRDVDADVVTYNIARGHLFTAKGLIVQAQKNGFVQNVEGLLADMDKLQQQIDQKAAELKALDETEEREKKRNGKQDVV
jgi:hypothetical protein